MKIDGIEIQFPPGSREEDLTPEMVDGLRDAIRRARAAETKEPSLAQKAASFATAVVKHVAAGCPTRTEERQAELKAICLSCVHQQGEASKCGVCGCSHMDLKRSMKAERCPMGFWPEDEP